MSENESTNKYACLDCNSVVSKEDKICPNCGANLAEEIKYAKFTKTKHRILFYAFFVVIQLLFPILINMLVETLTNSNNFRLNLDFSLGIMLALFVIANVVFTFWFISQSKRKRVFISASISTIILIIYYLINTLKVNGSILMITFIIFNELAYRIFNNKQTAES